MARPIKAGVDYFSHDTDSMGKKTLFTLESRFGNDGYAFWFKLLEILGTQEGLYYDCSNSANWLYLTAKTRVSEEKAEQIMSTLVQLEAIDPELWEARIIWVQKFVDRLKDLYKKRTAKIPEKPSFRRDNPTKTKVMGEKTPQSKVKKRIVKDIPPYIPPREDAETKNENEQDESLTVEMAQGSGELPVDHSRTLIQKRFDQFWSSYPKKVGKGAAEKSWKRIKPTKELQEKIMSALQKVKKTEQWERENGRYIPNPSTWLNQKRWEDEYGAVQSGMESSFDADDFFEAAVKRSMKSMGN